MMVHDEAVCRIISTYYAPDGTRRIMEGTLTDADGGKYTSANGIVAYVNGAIVKYAQVAHRTKGDAGTASGWVVAVRADENGKVVAGDDGALVLDFITGNVEVVLNAKHPYAKRIER